MKKLFILLFFIAFMRVDAQYIIAGNYSATDCYVDIIPDTTIQVGCHNVYACSPAYSVDLNCDMLPDASIRACCFHALGGSSGSSGVSPLNGAEIAFERTDTCYYVSTTSICSISSHAKAFNLSDTIGKNNVWKNFGLTLNMYITNGGPSPCGCFGGMFAAAGKFIGVRIPTMTDTTYGWVKISGVTAEKFTIESYCSTKKLCTNQQPLNIISSIGTICFGESSTLTASGALTYTWSTGANGSSIVVSPSVNTTYTVNGTYANGCTNGAVITQNVDACIGIEEYSNSHSLKLYPNPTKSIIEFILSVPNADLKIKLYNRLGQIVLEDKKANSNKFTLDVSNYPNGLYYVEVESKEGISRAKFVKN